MIGVGSALHNESDVVFHNELDVLFHTNAPWVVSQPVLLEHAIEDFDGETTRQTPWLRARFAQVLEQLQSDLDLEHDGATPLLAVTSDRLMRWVNTLPAQDRVFAAKVLRDFQVYLVRFGWVKTSSEING